MNSPLKWYLTSSAFFLVPGGIQMVMFPWLVAVFLHETPSRVGFAQMAGQIPMLLLILVGGLVGDRFDQRTLLIRLHLLMMLPPLVMASVIGFEWLRYEVLIAWALIGGVFGSFAQPARDALLNRVAGNDVQRIVMLTTGINFGVQIVGFAMGSMADRVGPIVLLCAQAICMGVCVWTTSKIPKMPPPARAAPRHPLREIGDGLALVWRSPTIRPATLLTFAVGIFFAGAFSVVLPLMVRDLYGGGAFGIALSFAMNMLGTVTTIVVLMRRGGVERPGRALLLGAMVSCVILSTLHWPMPQWLFYVVTFFWGMCGGISMTMGRSIVQEAAPASHRARVLSVYSLGMMGGMPVGSVVLGFAVQELGARNAILIPVIGMMSMVVYLWFASALWQARRQQVESVAAEEVVVAQEAARTT